MGEGESAFASVNHPVRFGVVTPDSRTFSGCPLIDRCSARRGGGPMAESEVPESGSGKTTAIAVLERAAGSLLVPEMVAAAGERAARMSYLPGDRDHRLSAQRRPARIRPADGGARKRPHDQALRPPQ
jgi:hypothetical protein